ncbi:MAG: type II toxin-antitoxin system RelE/ParE family toxin [Proteobacteria bacterium]|nr:type II toxin-antitoxin system RelE/ParE family toxin [Pseudomonadota bacterium]
MVKAPQGVQKIPLSFFATESGNEPVREWLKSLDEPDRKAIGLDLMVAQYGWPIGMPLCRPMGRGLFEIRTSLDDRIARVFVCHHDGELIALHGFIKKTARTPTADLKLARARQNLLSG